jgi:hypothetical protein
LEEKAGCGPFARGGRNTKIHALADAKGRLIAILLTGGLGDGLRHDQLATGTKLRVLTIIDMFSRFSPEIEPWFNFRGADVVEVPDSGEPRF